MHTFKSVYDIVKICTFLLFFSETCDDYLVKDMFTYNVFFNQCQLLSFNTVPMVTVWWTQSVRYPDENKINDGHGIKTLRSNRSLIRQS